MGFPLPRRRFPMSLHSSEVPSNGDPVHKHVSLSLQKPERKSGRFRVIAEFSEAGRERRYSATSDGVTVNLRQSDNGERWRKLFELPMNHYDIMAMLFQLDRNDCHRIRRFVSMAETLQTSLAENSFGLGLSEDLARNWVWAQRRRKKAVGLTLRSL
jgi:hypothetical protein